MRRLGVLVGVTLVVVAQSGCGGQGTPEPTSIVQVPTPTPSATPSPSPSPTATSTPTATATATDTPTLTVTPTPTTTPTPTVTPTPTITPTPTPNPLIGYTIEGLRGRSYPGGTIEISHVITETETFTKYLIRYPSEDPSASLGQGPSADSGRSPSTGLGQGLTITAMMNVPKGEGPFPVVILNHGYIPPSRYWSGADTWRAADPLASQGYLTVSPDFRGWGGSDSGANFFRTGLVIDALNLISSLPSLPEADPERVGMWGHSMGGGVTTKAITVDPRIKAAVLYAPVSGDDTDVIGRWGPGGRGGGTDQTLARAYRQAYTDPDFLQLTSPIHHLHLVTAPVQIHQGSADTSTPPEWAEAIWDSLQAADKDVEYFNYPGQGHALQGESWDLFMERVTGFFDRTLMEQDEP